MNLYSDTGCQTFEVLSLFMDKDEWTKLKAGIVESLRKSNHTLAAELLATISFEIYRGTNVFDDEFLLLYAHVSRLEYLKIKPIETNQEYKKAFITIAHLLNELELEEGNYIRFIATSFNVKQETVINVPNPIAQKPVIETLREAQTLIAANGPASAVDRVHTAIHRYLQEACTNAGLSYGSEDGICSLYKIIRETHPQLKADVGDQETNKIIRTLSAILDSLNTLRNNHSNVHPNQLLRKDEAVLAINVARTVLHYLDSKLA